MNSLSRSEPRFHLFANINSLGRMIRAYNEIVDFIASGSTPEAVAEFWASPETKSRVADLIGREKASSLTEEERTELDHYLELEHVMRLAKAKARKIVKE